MTKDNKTITERKKKQKNNNEILNFRAYGNMQNGTH